MLYLTHSMLRPILVSQTTSAIWRVFVEIKMRKKVADEERKEEKEEEEPKSK